MTRRSLFRRLGIVLLTLVLILGLGVAYWHYQTRCLVARVVEVGEWLDACVVQPNPVRLRNVVGGSRLWTGLTPLFCFLRTSAGDLLVIEVWIDSTLLDAKITKIECRMSGPVLGGAKPEPIDLPPETVNARKSIDLRRMFPQAFEDVGGVPRRAEVQLMPK